MFISKQAVLICVYVLYKCRLVDKYDVLVCTCTGHVCSSLNIMAVLMCVYMYCANMYMYMNAMY